ADLYCKKELFEQYQVETGIVDGSGLERYIKKLKHDLNFKEPQCPQTIHPGNFVLYSPYVPLPDETHVATPVVPSETIPVVHAQGNTLPDETHVATPGD